MLTNRREIHVEWGDCDPAGIVYFPRFFEYFDASTGALFEKAGLPKPEMLKKYGLVGILLIEASAQFFVPARFGETVTVETRIVEWGSSSFRVEHKLYKGDRLAAEGRERRVWTVRDAHRESGLRSEPVPEEVKDRFAK
jgi:4-hydroxybenzoyl-CoA thioesterase